MLSVKEEAASGMAPCSETEACSDGPGPSKKSKFLELLDDVMDQPTRDLQMLHTKKYRSTRVLMLTEERIPPGGGRIILSSCLF